LDHVNRERNRTFDIWKGGSMTPLKAEPPGPVRSLDEFFAVAHAMESDAVARYCDTAQLLRQQGADALARVFETLAQTERSHVEQVDAWAAHRNVPTPTTAALPWAVPDTHDAPPDEVAGSKLLTPYRALASAVRHEERAFAFWTYVSAHAQRPDVKDAAERMALEELEHVSILRRERRKAFHAERKTSVPAGQSVALISLASLEERLASFVEQHPESAAGQEFAPMIAVDARRAAATLDKIPPGHNLVISLSNIPSGSQDDPLAISEYLAEAYLRFAEAATDPDMLTTTQHLAAIAVYRLATLRSVAGDNENG
jgi:rubrerythrin